MLVYPSVAGVGVEVLAGVRGVVDGLQDGRGRAHAGGRQAHGGGGGGVGSRGVQTGGGGDAENVRMRKIGLVGKFVFFFI